MKYSRLLGGSYVGVRRLLLICSIAILTRSDELHSAHLLICGWPECVGTFLNALYKYKCFVEPQLNIPSAKAGDIHRVFLHRLPWRLYAIFLRSLDTLHTRFFE